jgi:hypothetical protein
MRRYVSWLALASGVLAFSLAGWLLASMGPKAAGNVGSAAPGADPHRLRRRHP